ncbi:MAG: hypothetical protein JWM10_4628 [Myxococcaceae bacterium]|nr:hypothetical protein [Myxococcaceae bacterium]
MHPGPFPPPQQPWAPAPPAPPARGGTGRILAFGCLGLVLLTVLGTLGAVFFLREKFSGTSLATTAITPGVRASLTYTDPGKGPNGAWLGVDVSHAQGFRVMGLFTVTANGRVLGQYNLNGDLSGRCTNPVINENTAACDDWRYTQVGANGTVAGQTRLFVIPAQPSGTAVSVVGTLYLASGVTVRRLALDVRD